MALFVVGRIRLSRFCSPASFNLLQIASITSAGGKPRERPRKPFDYRKKKFKIIDQLFDRTLSRLDENSRVIVVDGPPASGKTEFARRLATQLDFKFVPQPRVNNLWKCGEQGLTYQDLDDLLPPELRMYDLETFLTDKKAKLSDGGGRAGELQLDYFITRLFAYNDALLHLLSTGQGVVCVRSPWSDRVFARALHDNGYMSRNGYHYYLNEITRNHLCDFPRPHLVIYLDADVAQTKENIKQRNNTDEVNSAVFTDGFLQSVEDEYKDVVLPALESHGELLVYPSIPDISDHEVEMMVEDIEALGNLEHSGFTDDHHLADWENLRNEELNMKRREYQDLKLASKVYSHSKPWHAPEMCRSGDFEVARSKLYHYVPGYQWVTSYDPSITPTWKTLLGMRGLPPTTTDRRQFWLPA